MSTKIGFIGQGEKWDGTHFARPFQIVLELANRNIEKVYCSRREGLV
jgi:hypothetical protein